jgi:sugar/nucleoside kinase (ribokinase family)
MLKRSDLLLCFPGSAQLDELPVDSLKRIKETYKAFKAVAGSWAATAAHGAMQGGAAAAAAGQVGADSNVRQQIRYQQHSAANIDCGMLAPA